MLSPRLSDRSARQPLHSSGQTCCFAFDPAIRPMWPPGRSRWVTSSLATRSSNGTVPFGGAMWSAPAVTTSRFCSMPRQVDAFAAQPQAAVDEPVLLVHPGDPFAAGPRRRTAGCRRPTSPSPDSSARSPRRRGPAPEEPSIGGDVVRDRLHQLVRHVDPGARDGRIAIGDEVDVELVVAHPAARTGSRSDRSAWSAASRCGPRPPGCSAQYIAHSAPPMHQPSIDSSSSPEARSVSRTAQCSWSQTYSAIPISESSSSGTPQSTRKTS